MSITRKQLNQSLAHTSSPRMIKGVNMTGKTTELSNGSEKDLRTLRLRWNFMAIQMPIKKSLNDLKIQNFGSLKDAWSEKIGQVEKVKMLSTEITHKSFSLQDI